jgi:hypothetical protein
MAMGTPMAMSFDCVENIAYTPLRMNLVADVEWSSRATKMMATSATEGSNVACGICTGQFCNRDADNDEPVDALKIQIRLQYQF